MNSSNISNSELFNRLSDTDKVLAIVNDCPKINRKQISKVLSGLLPVTSVTSVTSVTEISNNSNDSNNSNLDIDLSSTENKVKTILNRLVEREDILSDKSSIPNSYEISEKGKEYISKLYNAYLSEVDKALQSHKKEYDLVQQIDDFFNIYYIFYKEKIFNALGNGDKALIIDCNELGKYNYNLLEQILENPEDTIRIMEIALEKFEQRAKDFKILFTNLPKSSEKSITHIRTTHLHKLITFTGEIRTRSDNQILCISAKFECPSCASTMTVLQLDSKFREPMKCGCGRKGKFKLIGKEIIDSVIMEASDLYENLSSNEMPQSIEVRLKRDIFETSISGFKEGDRIRIIGIPKERNIETKEGSKKTIFDKEVECFGIEKLTDDFNKTLITSEDEENFKNISSNPFSYFREKLFSDLDNIELATDLAIIGMFGGLHLAYFGDPGLGKSEATLRISKVALRSSFVKCETSTASGVIGTISKNPFTGKYALDGGVFRPLNPGGIAIMDELNRDKDFTIQDTISGIMSEHKINLTKAGTRINADCDISIWVTANCLNNHYDNYKPIYENFGLRQHIFNRLDFVVFFNNKLNYNNLDLIESLLKKNSRNFSISKEDLLLIKKYQIKANTIKVIFDNSDYKKISLLVQGFFEKIDPNNSYRRLSSFKQLLVSFCKLHLRNKPVDSDYVFLTDLIIRLENARKEYFDNHKN